jgi:hypothetical protein
VVEVFSVLIISGSGSSTSSEAHISADDVGTVVVVPEVVRGQWSPSVVTSLSVDPTGRRSSNSEF